MELSVAVDLIKQGVDEKRRDQVWADLGCGSGLFTEALSKLLLSPTIYAIDKDVRAARALASRSVKVVANDFVANPKLPEQADGVLMANSLHYVKDKISFVASIRESMKKEGRMIIVEYERFTANPWVPYPIDFNSLQGLAHEAEFKSCVKLKEYESVFNKGMMMYSAVMIL